MNLAERTQALVALLEQQRLDHRDEVIGKARAGADKKLKEAHSVARSRVRKLMEEERAAANAAIESARAHRDSERRANRRRLLLEQLVLARTGIREVLAERWKTDSRSAWLSHYAKLASELLPRTGWVVEHPADWTPGDSELIDKSLAAAGLPPPAYSLDESIEAGVRFCAGDAVLDATLEGLLLDGYETDARLLHHLGEAP